MSQHYPYGCLCGKKLPNYNCMRKHAQNCEHDIPPGTRFEHALGGQTLLVCPDNPDGGSTPRCVYTDSSKGREIHQRNCPHGKNDSGEEDSTEGDASDEEAAGEAPSTPVFVGWTSATTVPPVLEALSVAPPVPRHIKKRSILQAFDTKAQRVAAAFIAEESEQTWWNLLSLPSTLRSPNPNTWEDKIQRWPRLPDTAIRPDTATPRVSIEARKRAERLAGQQRYGAAKRVLLDSSTVHAPSEGVHNKLSALLVQDVAFPTEEDKAIFEDAKIPPIDMEGDKAKDTPIALVERLVQQVKNDAGVGLYGWTPQLLKWVCRQRPASNSRSTSKRRAPQAAPFAKALASYSRLLFRGEAPLVSQTMTSTLLPLDKTKGARPDDLSIRPICVESIITRVVCRTFLKHINATKALLPYQFGVKSPGGVEPIIHLLHGTKELMGSDDPDDETPDNLAMLDFSNAFNSISRSAILDGIKAFHSHLLPLASQMLEHPTVTLYDGVQYSTNSGSPQGNVLSPFFFSIGVRKALAALHARTVKQDRPTARYQWLGAYLDDATTRTSLSKDEIIAAWKDAEDSLAAPTKLRLSATKTVVIPTRQLCNTGLDVLGAHVGPVETTLQFLESKVEEHLDRVHALRSLSTNAHIRIFDVCLNTELTFYFRALSHEMMSDSSVLALCKRLDGTRYEWILARAGLQDHHVSCAGRLNATLPHRMGGAGLTSFCDLVENASASAARAAWSLLQKRKIVTEAMVPPICLSADPAEKVTTQKELSQRSHQKNLAKVDDNLTISQCRIQASNLSMTMRTAWHHHSPSVPFLNAAEWQLLCRASLLVDDIPMTRCHRCAEFHSATGHAANCLSFHYQARHNLCLDDMSRALEMDYVVDKEPLVGRLAGRAIRADLKLRPRVDQCSQGTITADLRIAEADSRRAMEIFTQATVARGAEDQSMAAKVERQTRALLDHHYALKLKHYAKEGVLGVTPWIITSMGIIHEGFHRWICQLKLHTRKAILCRICKRLLRGRAIRASHRL